MLVKTIQHYTGCDVLVKFYLKELFNEIEIYVVKVTPNQIISSSSVLENSKLKKKFDGTKENAEKSSSNNSKLDGEEKCNEKYENNIQGSSPPKKRTNNEDVSNILQITEPIFNINEEISFNWGRVKCIFKDKQFVVIPITTSAPHEGGKKNGLAEVENDEERNEGDDNDEEVEANSETSEILELYSYYVSKERIYESEEEDHSSDEMEYEKVKIIKGPREVRSRKSDEYCYNIIFSAVFSRGDVGKWLSSLGLNSTYILTKTLNDRFSANLKFRNINAYESAVTFFNHIKKIVPSDLLQFEEKEMMISEGRSINILLVFVENCGYSLNHWDIEKSV
jgi:hypothetical protein